MTPNCCFFKTRERATIRDTLFGSRSLVIFCVIAQMFSLTNVYFWTQKFHINSIFRLPRVLCEYFQRKPVNCFFLFIIYSKRFTTQRKGELQQMEPRRDPVLVEHDINDPN